MQPSLIVDDLAFIQGIGAPELLIILFIVLLLFGSKKLPELARGLGRSVKEFKRAAQDVEDDFKAAMDEHPNQAKVSPAAAVPATPPTPNAAPRHVNDSMDREKKN